MASCLQHTTGWNIKHFKNKAQNIPIPFQGKKKIKPKNHPHLSINSSIQFIFNSEPSTIVEIKPDAELCKTFQVT